MLGRIVVALYPRSIEPDLVSPQASPGFGFLKRQVQKPIIKISKKLGETAMFALRETKVLLQIFIVVVLGCAAVLAQLPESQPEPQPVQGIRIIRSNIHHDVSPSLLDMI